MRDNLPTEAVTTATATPTATRTAPPWTDVEAAAFLSVEPRTLRLWRQTRGLPYIRITSKAIRYRQQDVEAWLDRRRCQIRTA